MTTITRRIAAIRIAARRSDPARIAMIGVLVAYAGGRIVILAGARARTDYDTFTYAHRGDPAFDRGPLVSFTGHAPRLWGTPLFFAIFPTDQARALGLSILGALAWGLLALAVAGYLKAPWVRVAAAATILVVALLPPVTNWDMVILSEPVSITFGILVLAALIRWLTNRSTVALVGGTVVAFWWTFVRPELGLMVGFVFLTIAFVGWRTRQWLALSCASLLAVSMLWVTAITPTVSRTFAGWSVTGLSLDEETFTYRLRIVILANPALRRVYENDLGMPDCPAIDRVQQRATYSTGRFGRAYRSCPELSAWGRKNARSSGYRAALADPVEYARVSWKALPQSLDAKPLAAVPTPVPTALDHLVFPPSDKLVVPVVLGGLLAVLAALFAAGAWRRRRTMLLVVIGLAVASAASTLVGLLYSAGTLQRFGIQEAIGFRLAALCGLFVIADVLVERWRERRATPAADVAEPEPVPQLL